MTTSEFSNEFDTLVSSYRRFRDFDHHEPIDTIEFDEYEKSFFLTEAQELIVLELYNGNISGFGPFETDEMTRRMLDSLVKTKEFTTRCNDSSIKKISDNSVLYELNGIDPMAITLEYLKVVSTDPRCAGTSHYVDVIPVKQDEFLRMKRNPFKTFNKKRAFRLDVGHTTSGNSVSEIVTKYSKQQEYNLTYCIRYMEKPHAIILEELPGSLTIDGSSNKEECLLNPELHRIILRRAVLLALATKPTARG